jgi:hypothetical protein
MSLVAGGLGLPRSGSLVTGGLGLWAPVPAPAGGVRTPAWAVDRFLPADAHARLSGSMARTSGHAGRAASRVAPSRAASRSVPSGARTLGGVSRAEPVE